MMKYIFSIFIFTIFNLPLFSQVIISPTNGTAHPSAMLDVDSDSKGILIPRLTSNQRTLISNPKGGLMVYDKDSNSFWYYDGNSSAWTELLSEANRDQHLIEDADGDTQVLMEANSGADVMRFLTKGTEMLTIKNTDQGHARLGFQNNNSSILMSKDRIACTCT